MNSIPQPPKGDTDELREKLDDIFDTFNNNDALDIHTLAGEFECMHLTDTGKQMVVDLVERYASQHEIQVLKEVWNRTQPPIVPEGVEPDELGKWLLSEIKKRKEEQPNVR